MKVIWFILKLLVKILAAPVILALTSRRPLVRFITS